MQTNRICEDVERELKEHKANGEKDTKDHIEKAKSELKEELMHSNDKIERKIQLKLEEPNKTITKRREDDEVCRGTRIKNVKEIVGEFTEKVARKEEQLVRSNLRSKEI